LELENISIKAAVTVSPKGPAAHNKRQLFFFYYKLQRNFFDIKIEKKEKKSNFFP
jgi:hypothetical protein